MFRFSRLFVLIGFFITVAFCYHASAQDSIIVRRAAFDIGSAAIKCVIADVDIVSGRVVKVVKDLTQKVDFAEDLARSYDGNFSKEIMKDGLEALRKFKLVALERSVREWSAVSGAAFQKARNGRAYCVTIQDETGIPCRISSEQQAAMLSYHAVRLGLKMPDDSLLVWDIGGGSAHMTTRNLDGGMTFHTDKLASVSFKNVVIEKIKGQDINVVSTPNPMTEEDVQRALQLVESHMEMTVRQSLAERVAKTSCVSSVSAACSPMPFPKCSVGKIRVHLCGSGGRSEKMDRQIQCGFQERICQFTSHKPYSDHGYHEDARYQPILHTQRQSG